MQQIEAATVLVVDDEEENQRVLARQLGAEGFGVVTANSGAEALALLRAGGISAVLMDVVMPELDGVEVTRRIKQDDALNDVPVIIVTGFSDAPARIRALSAGAEEFLARPVDRTEMGVRLRNLLRLRAAHQELKQRNAALSQMLAQESERVAYFERFTRSAFDALSAHIAVLDSRGVVVSVNEAWRRFMRERGVAFEVGRPYRAEQLAAADDAPRLQAAVLAVARGDQDQCVLEYAGGGGPDLRWFTVRVTRIQGVEPSFVVASHEDVTEERAMRTELAATAAKLQESRQQMVHAQHMETVGRLTGGVAHDFNNMLTSIICFTRFVVDEMAPEDPRRGDLVEVLRAADNAARLTNQLLAFSRRKPVQPKLLDANAALSSVGRVLRRSLGERIELVLVPAEEQLSVTFDSGQFDQLVFNLVINAKDAMPGGGSVTVKLGRTEVTSHSDLSSGDYVELTVSDTGEGMTRSVRARALEPFFTTKGERGAGLGLAICDGIVKQAGGAISIESEPGGGTTFRVLIPRSIDPRPRDPRRSLSPLQVALQGTVLVVEDQPAILRTMSRALGGVGMQVLEAVSAEDALSLLESRGGVPELLVTDMVLPGMTGQRLAARLRELRPDLKVLFVSGYASEDAQHAVQVDAQTSFVAKPFTGRQLASRAALLLGVAGRAEPVSG